MERKSAACFMLLLAINYLTVVILTKNDTNKELLTLAAIYIITSLIRNRYILTFKYITIIYIFLAYINRIKRKFWGTGIVFEDLYFFKDTSSAWEILKYYKYDLPLLLLETISVTAILSFIIIRLSSNHKDTLIRSKLLRWCMIFICGTIIYHINYKNLYPQKNIDEGKTGILYNVISSINYNLALNVNKELEIYRYNTKHPVGFHHITEKMRNNGVDIVVILLESTFNPYTIYDRNIILNIDMLSDTKAYINPLYVHVYGGMTWNTQFHFLTGLTLNKFTPTIQVNPYLLLDRFDKSLPSSLRDIGYTTYGFTTMKKSWRGQMNGFRLYGFDEHNSAPTKSLIGNNCAKDEYIFNEIESLLKQDSKNNKFIYFETMCNHGPHSTNADITPSLCPSGITKNTCLKMQDYIGKLKIVNSQLESLINYINNTNKKTLLVYFGDHLPSFEGGMEELIDKYKINRHTTFYGVKANFDIDSSLLKPIDVKDLGRLIIEILGSGKTSNPENSPNIVKVSANKN